MTTLLWVAAAVLLAALAVGGLVWLAFRLGESRESEDHAEDLADERKSELDRRREPVLVGPARYNRLRRTWARLRRLQDRETQP